MPGFSRSVERILLESDFVGGNYQLAAVGIVAAFRIIAAQVNVAGLVEVSAASFAEVSADGFARIKVARTFVGSLAARTGGMRAAL